MKRIIQVSPLLAFLFYGGWACLVNYEPDSDIFMLAGLIQGIYAFISTMILKLAVYSIHRQLSSKKNAQLYTFIVILGLLILIPSMLHLIFGTHNVLAAITPGVLIGR